VEQAIELFFETGGMDLAATAPTNPPPPPPAERRPEPPDVVDVDNFPVDTQETGAAAHDIDQDEALARRLMQEDIDNSGSGNGNNDGVRSPIAARQDILVHPDMDYNQSYRYASRGRGRLPLDLLC
jgi:UBX domain-containing protein 7